ncbi:hypothetical protein BGZ60DRAFT_532962 [Tricladium varicosporioides]|nr:hypothetical protein BGZ60DRAFT_532962 [Hymenoscyphus varicosporioides]
MGVIQQRMPLAAQTLPLARSLQHHEALWVGLGALLGFLFVSFIFGALETIRGNTPDSYRETVERLQTSVNKITELSEEKDAIIVEKDAIEADIVAAVTARDDAFAERQAAIDARIAAIAARDEAVAQRQIDVTGAVAARNQANERLEEAEEAMTAAFIARDTAIAERDATNVEMQLCVQEAAELRDRLNDYRESLAATRTRLARLDGERAMDAYTAQIELDIRTSQTDQTIGELRLQVNNHRQTAMIASTRIRELENEAERAILRINVLQEQILDLQPNDNERVQQAAANANLAEMLENSETRASELRLNLNTTQGNLRSETRTRVDLERRVQWQDKIIAFLNQKIAEQNLDQDHQSLSEATMRPQTPVRLIDFPNEEFGTSGPIPNRSVRRLVTGLQRALHVLGSCSHAQEHKDKLEDLDVLVEGMRDFMEQLNDSMFEELVQLVLDVMGHLGVRQ